MMGNMESALTRFVQTGKLSMKDLARSIITDLIAIQMKAQATALFSKLIGGIFGASSAYGSATSYASTAAQGWLGFANGGDPPVNKPSIVGERGPELFVPKSAGTIIPNHQLSSLMGGGQTINYNGPFIQQMSAIDTQSGIQFLAQNKQAVWAANQSAQRSLPMSR
jgi:lambda family phage tail tape measure protein